MKIDTANRDDRGGVSPRNFRQSDPSQREGSCRRKAEGVGAEKEKRRYP